MSVRLMLNVTYKLEDAGIWKKTLMKKKKRKKGDGYQNK